MDPSEPGAWSSSDSLTNPNCSKATKIHKRLELSRRKIKNQQILLNYLKNPKIYFLERNKNKKLTKLSLKGKEGKEGEFLLWERKIFEVGLGGGSFCKETQLQICMFLLTLSMFYVLLREMINGKGAHRIASLFVHRKSEERRREKK